MTRPALINLPDAVHRIAAARKIIITTHARADGDALACTMAMQRILREIGDDVHAYLHEPVQSRYAFLIGDGPPRVWSPAEAAGILAAAELLLIVDTCAANQLGNVADPIRRAALPKLAIDHHITRDDIADAAFVDESAAACAQLIVELCDHAGWTIDRVSAEILFVGLATDTGWFRFSNTDGGTLSTASRLVSAGAMPNELYERLYLCETLPRARLIGEIMSSFELLADGRLAVIRLRRDAFRRAGAKPDMTEELINEPQRLGSVVACVMLVEPMDDGPVRVSLRSKRDIDVARIAGKFGGGGHARAAGAKINAPFEQAADQVVGAMLAAMDAR